ncbi:hypothetical protein, partial [Parabacteroides sp. D25]|uniref:hypothetical protein n=1 Tax=Parabacteroides sp. D25 TaxID=658661 RepID=UPI001E4E7B94
LVPLGQVSSRDQNNLKYAWSRSKRKAISLPKIRPIYLAQIAIYHTLVSDLRLKSLEIFLSIICMKAS